MADGALFNIRGLRPGVFLLLFLLLFRFGSLILFDSLSIPHMRVDRYPFGSLI